MRTVLIACLAQTLLISAAFASSETADPAPAAGKHRYIVERSFPEGAIDGVDAAAKQKVNANNASVGVSWVRSFANEKKTKTYCVYDGPNPDSIRQAAKLSGMNANKITEVPLEVTSGAAADASAKTGETHRFVVVRETSGKAKDLDAANRTKVNDTNARFGVRWVNAYASADKTKAYAIYEAPSEAAVQKAAAANGVTIASIEEIPVTLLPN